MKFAKIAEVYEKLEHITSGNAIRELLSKFFKTVSHNEIDKVAYLTLGQIAPEYENINLGIAEKMVLRSIAQASKQKIESVTKEYKKLGDAGLAAQKFVGKKRKDLTILELFYTLQEISRISGEKSQDKKINILSKLLENASALEARYICRIVLGMLRLGVANMTVLDSLAIAFTGDKKAKKKLQDAYNVCPDIGIIARTIATKGTASVSKIPILNGRPIQMMIEKRVTKFEEIKQKIPGEIAAEEKYDGERVQAHKKGNKIILYSRRMEKITAEFPEIIGEIKTNVNSKDCIIEGECVAV